MSISEGKKVTAPVGVPEMARLFQCTEDTGSICTSDNINKFAKYKSLVWGSPTILTDSIRYELNHGFTPKYLTISESSNNPKMPIWGQWRVPNPDIGEWCRLADFNGYNHNAVQYIREVDIHTDHKDTQSIILNNGSVNTYITYAPGIDPLTVNVNDLSPLLKGSLYVKVSINPDADLKLSDFHWDNPNGTPYDLKNFYWCVALISPWLIQSGNQSAFIGYSEKTVGELETNNAGGDAIELKVDTAPGGNLYSAMTSPAVASDRRLILVIGLVRDNTNNFPKDFWSPVIFTEWSELGWTKQYTTYKVWNGNQITQNINFRGGLFNESMSLIFERNPSAPRVRPIYLQGVRYQVLRDTGGGVDSTTKVNIKPKWRLQLQHTDGTSVTQEGEIDVGAGNSREWEAGPEDIIDTLTFPQEGTYSGTFQMWVDNTTTVPIAYLNGELALVNSINRLGDYNGFVSSVSTSIRITIA